MWLASSAEVGHLDVEGGVEILFELAAEQTGGNRPGRIEPRAIERRALSVANGNTRRSKSAHPQISTYEEGEKEGEN